MKKFNIIGLLFIFILLISIVLPNFSTKNNDITIAFKSNSNYIKNNFITDFKLQFFNNRFIVYTKPDISPLKDTYPVIFLFHGAVQHSFSWFLGLNKWNRAQVSFTKYVLDNGFFVVSFESLKPIKPGPRVWDAFEKKDSLNSDILFVKRVINWLSNSSLPVDINSIFCAGLSSGAFFCSRLSQSYNYSFKGIILNSGCNADCINISKIGPVFNSSTGFNISCFHPPTLIIHGKKDKLVPYECSKSYYLDLNNSGVDVSLISDDLGGHIWFEKYNSLIVDWIKKH
jgi:poly(3-hydroxybutyrate) depolymerase